MSFLPIKKEEAVLPVDFVFVTGEAYCDHPTFGAALISRMLEHFGFSVGIIAQPQKGADIKEFGMPRIGFFVSSGVVDSMVNNFSVSKLRRKKDVYSEGADPGMRPDRAVTVYTRMIKKAYPASTVVIGGIEASLRRFAHYDYWDDKVMPSILEDSGADLLIYGMGEVPIIEMCKMLKKNIPLSKIRDLDGTCYMDTVDNLSKQMKEKMQNNSLTFCPTYDEVCKDKKAYIKAFNMQGKNNDHISGRILIQKTGNKYVVQNVPQRACTIEEMDMVYALPYERTYHPVYTRGVPAIDEVKYSITSQRGCFGSCSYCAITFHQGRVVQKRSKASIVREVELFLQDKDFKGYVHDVGGPTANFRNPSCKAQSKVGVCKDKTCMGHKPCDNIEVSHTEYLDLLRTLREMEGIKKVFIRSGIRYDYLMMDRSDEFLHELVKHHVSGQLKVAPEHTEEKVLKLMNKPSFEVYEKFKEKFDNITKKLGKKQYLVPYLISSHPGCTLKDAVRLAEYLKSIGYMPEQVQDFYPTPSTKSTCMYYTGINPDTMEEVFVPKTFMEKKMQRALLQYRKKENYTLVREALILAGRKDLIGFGEHCLIKPTQQEAIENSVISTEIGPNMHRNIKGGIRNGKASAYFGRNTTQAAVRPVRDDRDLVDERLEDDSSFSKKLSTNTTGGNAKADRPERTPSTRGDYRDGKSTRPNANKAPKFQSNSRTGLATLANRSSGASATGRSVNRKGQKSTKRV